MAEGGIIDPRFRQDVQQLQIEAQYRWLRPAEIYAILKNYQSFQMSSEPPVRPASGSLFLFDRNILRYFRLDGHNWKKKKDGKTVNEAHEKLKVGSVDVLHCYYAHREDNEYFQRRSYWLLEKEFTHIVFVHYLEVKGNSSTIREIEALISNSQPHNALSSSKSGCHNEALAGTTGSPSIVSSLTSTCDDVESDGLDHSKKRVAEGGNMEVANNEKTVIVISDDDRQPSSPQFEGAGSPLTADIGTARQCDDNRGEHDQGKKLDLSKDKAQEKNDVLSQAVDDNASQRLDETIQSTTSLLQSDEELPFKKDSHIWKMIESMEVFKRIPQKPHFRPLYDCKEECREGLAIGNMVTFSTLVEKVSKLKFSDPKSVLEGHLDALNDLEQMGFNVVPVRDQLNTMLAIKSRYEPAWNSYKDVENKIMERSHEKLKIDEEIVELEKKIEELHEKRRLAASTKKIKDSEIMLLQSGVDTVKGSLESAKEEFEKVTASFCCL